MDEANRRLDVHALRRTANTRLLRFGVPIMTAATILGHQDPKITAKHYSELRLADTLAAVEKLPPLVAREDPAEYGFDGFPNNVATFSYTSARLTDEKRGAAFMKYGWTRLKEGLGAAEAKEQPKP